MLFSKYLNISTKSLGVNMNDIDLKNLSLNDHISLFKKNVFTFISIIILIALLFISCKKSGYL